MLQFQPEIVREEVLELPRPILVCRILDSWDFLKLKVPLRDGDQLAGPSRDGTEIVIEGKLGSHGGELTLSEEAMLEALIALRQALQSTDDEGYRLSLYRNAGSDDCRYFQRCVTRRCDLDLSNKQLYSYSLSIHACDPVLYEGPLP